MACGGCGNKKPTIQKVKANTNQKNTVQIISKSTNGKPQQLNQQGQVVKIVTNQNGKKFRVLPKVKRIT